VKNVVRGLTVEGHRLIKAPLQRVWHLLSRLESHPRYVTLWLAADVRERSPTAAVVEFRGFFGGLPIASTQRVTLKPPTRIDFRQIRGELRDLAGSYTLADVDSDTDVVVHLTIDASIPLFPEASVRQIAISHIDGTLSRIKASAERDLVRLIPRRVRPGAGVSPDGPGDAEAPAAPPAALVQPISVPDAIEAPGGEPLPPDEGKGVAPAFPVTSGSIQGATGTTAAGGAAAAPAQPGGVRRGRRRRRRRGRGHDAGRTLAPGAGEQPGP